MSRTELEGLTQWLWSVWEGSLRDTYGKSPALQQFLRDHPDWYTDEVHRMLTGVSPARGARPTA